MPVLLCYGDSNTHGTPPILTVGEYRRFDATTRWPVLAAKALGWELAEEGLPGRTAQFDDPGMDGLMNGHPALRQALQSHGPLDVLVLMLGTINLWLVLRSQPRLFTSGRPPRGR